MSDNGETTTDGSEGFGQGVSSGYGEESEPGRSRIEAERDAEEMEAEWGASSSSSSSASEQGSDSEAGEESESKGFDEVRSPVNNNLEAPYFLTRPRAKAWRGIHNDTSGTTMRLDMFPETRELVEELVDEANDEMYPDVNITRGDVLEGAIRAVCKNPELLQIELDQWGCKTAQMMEESQK